MREKLVFNGFSLNIGKEKLKCFAEFSGEKLFENKLILNMYHQNFSCSKAK